MTMSDPLGDLLTRLRNGQKAHKIKVPVLYSSFHGHVLEVLKREGYIRGYHAEDLGRSKKQFVVELKYNDRGGVIQEIKRVSKPGRRIYSRVDKLPAFYGGLGIYVLSTPQGVISDYEAREKRVGGEILCQVF